MFHFIRSRGRRSRVTSALIGLCLGVATLALGTTPASAQNFTNSRVAEMGLAELGTRRTTGWNQQGECIKSAQRWVLNAGGTFGGGGVLSGYRNSGATQLSGLGQASKGDVFQRTNGNDGDWANAHTVVVVQNYGNGHYWIVQSNAPGYVNGVWRTDYSGLVTENRDWVPASPSGWYWTAWRFGNVNPEPAASAIRSLANGQYVSAELDYGGASYGTLRARSSLIGSWERVRFVGDCGSSAGCAIQSSGNNLYVSAELGYGGAYYGMLRARATSVGSWERFRLVGDCRSSSGCAIQSVANNLYVSAELGYTGQYYGMLRARSSSVGPWERFQTV